MVICVNKSARILKNGDTSPDTINKHDGRLAKLTCTVDFNLGAAFYYSSNNFAVSVDGRRYSQIGRQLARIGDDINVKYASRLNRMVRGMFAGSEPTYDHFAEIARK